MLVAGILSFPIMAQQNKSGNNTDSKKSYKPGSAWTLVTPLGLHEKSSIDTLLYNYQREFIPTMVSDAYATTGQLTGPGLDMIYFNRKNSLPFIFANPIEYWIPTFEKEKFYNVYIPMTLLSYNFSVGQNTHSDLLKATFAGNVNRKIGVGAFVDYPYTKGCYTDQAAKGLNFGFQFYYRGDRYQAQTFYNNFYHLNKENGGIENDLYITNPAEVQGGVTSIDAKSIPVNLSGVHNELRGQQFYMNHAYNLGFHRDITQETDTVPRYEFVPVTRILYSFDFQSYKRRFTSKDLASNEDIWPDHYINSACTDERDKMFSVANTLGIEMIEGFQKWAQFGLAAWATYDYSRNWFIPGAPAPGEDGNPGVGSENLTPLPDGVNPYLKENRHRLWVAGRLARTKGRVINYSAEGKFGLVGEAAGEIFANGKIDTRFRLGKDTVAISAHASFKNETPDWFLRHYSGNHFMWNNNFGKIRSIRAGGKLFIPWSNTLIGVDFENLQNHVYFNQNSLPQQYGGSIQIISAYIDQKLRFGIWNWNNRITYQQSSNRSILPLPVLTVYSNMFLRFKIVKVLEVQLGVDCDYYTKYPGMVYQPATMSFHVQGDNPQFIGNYAFCNVYLTCKLKKTRFFLMCSHVNQDWFGRNYFSMPHYPVNPRQFRLGVSIDFAN